MSKTPTPGYRYNCDHCKIELAGSWIHLGSEVRSPTLHIRASGWEWEETVYDELDFCNGACAGIWLRDTIHRLRHPLEEQKQACDEEAATPPATEGTVFEVVQSVRSELDLPPAEPPFRRSSRPTPGGPR